MEKKFIEFCEKIGAYCYRTEQYGKNGDKKEIVYCTKKGIIYQLFDGEVLKYKYPQPSELKDCGIIHYLIEECLECGRYMDICELAKFLSLTNIEKNIQGLPHEYFYGWVWEHGNWDKKAEKVIITEDFIDKDKERITEIYECVKDGQHIDVICGVNLAKKTKEVFDTADKFYAYFKESGLSVEEFVEEYNNCMIENSLMGMCTKVAGNLLDTFVENSSIVEQAKIAEMLYGALREFGADYFPIKK